ncbi:MAG: NUDIX hydrolase [Pirellulales bacterium]|nr:NUDIX hydrolase [Pirellulales bacterium]
MHEPNDQAHAERIHGGKFLSLFRSGRWEFAHRENATGAIAIVAVTPEERILLVEQYRPPVGAACIELPAGLVGDEPGDSSEDVVAAACRELEEETGYQAGNMSVLLTGPSSAGLTSEMITLLLASDLRKVGPGGGVEHEEITVHEIPVDETPDFLRRQESAGKPVDFKVYAGLYFLAARDQPHEKNGGP